MPFFQSDIFNGPTDLYILLKEFSKLICFEDFQNSSKIPSNGGPTLKEIESKKMKALDSF